MLATCKCIQSFELSTSFMHRELTSRLGMYTRGECQPALAGLSVSVSAVSIMGCASLLNRPPVHLPTFRERGMQADGVGQVARMKHDGWEASGLS